MATVLNADVAAVVSRVDPAVTQNSVAVDLAFAEDLPPGARPDLSIRATVTVAKLADVLFVRRPLGVNDDGTTDLLRLADDGRSASRTAVRFGLRLGRADPHRAPGAVERLSSGMGEVVEPPPVPAIGGIELPTPRLDVPATQWTIDDPRLAP